MAVAAVTLKWVIGERFQIANLAVGAAFTAQILLPDKGFPAGFLVLQQRFSKRQNE